MYETNFKVTPDLYASKGSRFANYIIDFIVVFITIFVVAMIFLFLYSEFSTDTTAVDNFFEDDDFSLLDRLIISLIVAFFYFIMEISLKGKSIGKYITKTRVVMEDGSNPKALNYIKRSLCRMIPFEQLTFLKKDGRGFHDSISNTYVVDEKLFLAKKETINSLDQIGKHIED